MPADSGDVRDAGWIPEWRRSPRGGHGDPLQYSCLENPMDRGAWQATVQRITKKQTHLKRACMRARAHTHTHTQTYTHTHGDRVIRCKHFHLGAETKCLPSSQGAALLPRAPAEHQERRPLWVRTLLRSNESRQSKEGVQLEQLGQLTLLSPLQQPPVKQGPSPAARNLIKPFKETEALCPV